MLKVRTRTYELTVNEATDAKADGNGYVLIYKKVKNAEDKDYLLPVVVVSPNDFLTAYDPDHVEAELIPPSEKHAGS